MQNSVHPDGDIQDVTAEDLSDSLQWHLHHTLAVSQSKETDGDWYLAFSVGLRDQLAERWMKTQDCYAGKKVRRAYYLSLEFLIGRPFFQVSGSSTCAPLTICWRKSP